MDIASYVPMALFHGSGSGEHASESSLSFHRDSFVTGSTMHGILVWGKCILSCELLCELVALDCEPVIVCFKVLSPCIHMSSLIMWNSWNHIYHMLIVYQALFGRIPSKGSLKSISSGIKAVQHIMWLPKHKNKRKQPRRQWIAWVLSFPLGMMFISWFICYGRWCIGKLGFFHANQISMCLDPHLN